MSAYPDELLPKPNFKTIDTDTLPQFAHLIRRSSKDRLNTFDSVGDVRIDAIIDATKERDSYKIFNLSTNLFGVFRTEHLKYRIPYTLNPKWTPNTVIPSTEEISYSEMNNAVPIFLPVHNLHRQKFPINKTPLSVEGSSLVTHDPLMFNYWHYELRFNEPDGTAIQAKESAWRNDAAKHFIKSYIKIFATGDEPDTQDLDKSIYQSL